MRLADWPFQASIFVGGASRPLGPGAIVAAQPGCLVEVLAKGERRMGVRILQDQLVHADACLREVHRDGFPPVMHQSHCYAVLQLLEEPARVQYVPLNGMHDLPAVLLSHACRAWRPYRLVWPRSEVLDYWVRGRNVCRVSGAFPVQLGSRVPVIVDGRRVGLPLRMYASLTGRMALHEFLDAIELHYDSLGPLEVEGSVTFDPGTTAITVQSGDIVVLSYRLQPLSDAQQALPTGGGHLPDTSDAPGRGEPRHTDPAQRERLPRVRPGGQAGASFSGGASGGRSVKFVKQMATYRCLDASAAKARVAQSVRLASLLGLQVQLVETALQGAPLVLEGPETHVPPAAPANDVVGVFPHAHTGDDALGRDVDSSPSPDLKRVQVCVLRFQQSPTFSFLWMQQGESLPSVMRRGQILLNQSR